MEPDMFSGPDSYPVIHEFAAAFDSRCAQCDCRIFEGDMVAYLEDEVCCEQCVQEWIDAGDDSKWQGR